MAEPAVPLMRPEVRVEPHTVPGSRGRSTLRFIVSVFAAGSTAVLTAVSLRRPLSVRTDVVGYPIYANFNSYNYFHQYYIAILLFPALALLIYELIGRVWAESSWPAAPPAPPIAPDPQQRLVSERSASQARLFVVGASLAILWSMLRESRERATPVAIGLVALGYVVAVSVAERLLALRRPAGAGRNGSPINAAIAPFSVLLFEAVAARASVAVANPPALHTYRLLPLLLTLGLAGGAVALTWIRLWRSRGEGDPRRVESDAIWYFVVPSLLVVVTAAVPPPMGGVDLFHAGELTVAPCLFRRGALPWKDLVLIHGVLNDLLLGLWGFSVFGESIWAGLAGFTVFGTPLWWLTNFFLFLYLFRERKSFLFAGLAAAFVATFPFVHWRFLPYPVVLLALASVLRKGTWPRSFLLAVLVVGGNLLVPELAYLVPAVAIVLFVRDLATPAPGQSPWRRFHRTLKVGVAGIAVTLVACALLGRAGLLEGLVEYYWTFGPGHELAGAFPLKLTGMQKPPRLLEAVLPPVLVILSIWYVIAHLRMRRSLAERDWVMLAAAVVTAGYYGKFIARPDAPHLAQAIAPALPLLWYALKEGLDRVGTLGGPLWRRWLPPVAMASAAAWMVAPAPLAPLYILSDVRGRYRIDVPSDPILPRVGWSNSQLLTASEREWKELDGWLKRVVKPGETLFDFTNQPALYHFILGYPPASRFYNVQMAIRRDSQALLLAELKERSPAVVVYGSERGGLPEWDGIPNAIRHYDVSRFVLDRYERAAKVAGQALYVRKLPAAEAVPSTEDDGQRCDWGYAPNFLDGEPMRLGPTATPASRQHGRRLTVGGWAVQADGEAAATEIVAVAGGVIVGRAPIALPRPDVVDALRLRGDLLVSGFSLDTSWVTEGEADDARTGVRVFALTRTGRATELPVPWSRGQPRHEPPPTGLPPEDPAAIRAAVDRAELENQVFEEFDLPENDPAAPLSGLSFDLSADRSGVVSVYRAASRTGGTGPEVATSVRTLRFRVPAGTKGPVQVQLDNCVGWRAVDRARLFVRSDTGIEVRGVRALARADGPGAVPPGH
jgi:hypothetical protein